MFASVEQRAAVGEKSATALAWAGVRLGELDTVARQYGVDKWAGVAFEGVGRAVLWLADAIGEVFEMRWCCLRV